MARIMLCSTLVCAISAPSWGQRRGAGGNGNWAVGDADAAVRQAQVDLAAAQSFSDDVHWRIRKLPDEIRTQQQAMAKGSAQIAQVQTTVAGLAQQIDTLQADAQQRQTQITDAEVQLAAAQNGLNRTRAAAITQFESSTAVIEARAALDVAEEIVRNASAMALRELAKTPAYQRVAVAAVETRAQWIWLRYSGGGAEKSVAKAAEQSWAAAARLEQLQRSVIDADFFVREARASVTDAQGALRKLRADFDVQLAVRPEIVPMAAAVKSLEQTRATHMRETVKVQLSLGRAIDEHLSQTTWLKSAAQEMAAMQAKLDSLTADYQAAVAAVRDVDWSVAAATETLNQAIRYRDQAQLAYNRPGRGGNHNGGNPPTSPGTDPTPPSDGGGSSTPPATQPMQSLRTEAWKYDNWRTTTASRSSTSAYDPHTPQAQAQEQPMHQVQEPAKAQLEPVRSDPPAPSPPASVQQTGEVANNINNVEAERDQQRKQQEQSQREQQQQRVESRRR